MATLNANPIIHSSITNTSTPVSDFDSLLSSLSSPAPRTRWSSQEVFDIVRNLNDPEHPLTLEQLNVAQLSLITVDDEKSRIHLNFTPTIPHCSMATLIGLALRVKLLRSLPARFKVEIAITPGTHASEAAINKQLNDKERVAAALENNSLLDVVEKSIARTDKMFDW